MDKNNLPKYVYNDRKISTGKSQYIKYPNSKYFGASRRVVRVKS